MARNVTARAVHFRRGLNFFTLSNKPFIHSWLLVVPILAPTFTNPLRQTAEIQALPKLNWNAPRVLRCGNILYPGNRHSPCLHVTNPAAGMLLVVGGTHPCSYIQNPVKTDCRDPSAAQTQLERSPCVVMWERPVPRK